MDTQAVQNQLKPSDYGLKHTDWRPGQLEMIQWAHEAMTADSSRVGICEAATGTGKTTLPRALSKSHKTVALVRTKSLQSANYEDGYGFIPLYGRSNYDCVHEDAEQWTNADECLFAESGMHTCEHGKVVLHPEDYNDLPVQMRPQKCSYVLARENAKDAQRAVLNYSYWLHSYERWPQPAVLVCDEAHQLPDITLEWAGCTISEKARQQWELVPFPMIRGGGGMLADVAPATERAVNWLKQSLDKLRTAMNELKGKPKDDEKARKQLRQVELLGKKLRATVDALQSEPNEWYIKSGPAVQGSQPAFVARPLTAKWHFKRYFMNPAWHLFLMSATIGDPQVFADELGLDSFNHHCVPSLFPAIQRPVLALDVPSMGKGATDKELGKRADEIAKAIKGCPSDWSGIIHVTAIKEAPELAVMLAKRGLQDRVWVAPTEIRGRKLGTEGMIEAWNERRQKVKGSLNISWAFWEGYDGREEKISIVAKMPFPYLGDEYEVARRNRNAKLYLQRTAWAAEQGCGRSRRGRAEDYDTDEEKRGLVCIADGAYRMVKSYFSQSFRESIIKN